MKDIGMFLLLTGTLGLVLSMLAIIGRKPARALSRDFDFGHAKRFENSR